MRLAVSSSYFADSPPMNSDPRLHRATETEEPLLATPKQETMGTDRSTTMWQDVRQHRRAYFLTAVASFGGMLFGWDTVRLSPLSVLNIS